MPATQRDLWLRVSGAGTDVVFDAAREAIAALGQFATDQDELGKIFRRNTPYGTASEHGTVFIGFCAEQGPLHTMLRRMSGAQDGTGMP
jgi:deferrochelatase/peroxidase EfeB